MASDLDVTTATWGTSNLIGTTGEVLPSTVQAQMANNEGYAFYQPRMIAAQEGTVANPGALTSESHKAYMAEGTYTAWAAGYGDFSGANGGAVRIEADGTTIATGTDTEWFYGSAEVIVTSTGWVGVRLMTDAPVSGTVTLRHASVFVRQTDA